jgi:hypothetical protein
MTDRDKYGSRNYQIILRRMQLLPCSSYLNPSSIDTKGKRKASEEPVDGGAAKKANNRDDDCDMLV